MASELCVIALISGGKDSLFSILHCQAQGHRVVALANLYPSIPRSNRTAVPKDDTASTEATEDDLNSFMYQTVGHSIIPLYEEALGIPLYRQQIRGSAVNSDVTYSWTGDAEGAKSSISDESQIAGRGHGLSGPDETESLLPLLKRIKEAHPDANAVSTGAILSDYQRTRVESVALRLKLIPLSFLWHYPSLPHGTPMSLLDDMLAVGQDARIIKVASGGLDESHLWENVASTRGKSRLSKAMQRLGGASGGALLGEGGEFETLAIDGPPPLWKKRIEIRPEHRAVILEGSGSALLRITEASAVPKNLKDEDSRSVPRLRIPDLLDEDFVRLLDSIPSAPGFSVRERNEPERVCEASAESTWCSLVGQSKWYISNMIDEGNGDIRARAESITLRLQTLLAAQGKSSDDIVFTTIVLRSISQFDRVNKVYGLLFTKPSPPARVTVAVGEALPDGHHIMMSVVVDLMHRNTRRGLHVQSRSYWAPANIGPYSQAIATRENSPASVMEGLDESVVYFAGQIPLVPATMKILSSSLGSPPLESFKTRSVLALQHLWRVGRVMDIGWWATGIAFITGDDGDIEAKATIAGQCWKVVNRAPVKPATSDDDEEIDIWDQRYGKGLDGIGCSQSTHDLPDFSKVSCDSSMSATPPFCVVRVAELPRESDVEWAASGLILHRGKHISEFENGHFRLQAISPSSGPGPVFIQVSVLMTCPDVELQEWIQKNFTAAQLPLRLGLSNKLEMEHITMFKRWGTQSLGFGESCTIIPCYSLWDVDSRRLRAAMIIRCACLEEPQDDVDS